MEVEAQQKLEETKQDIDYAVNNPVSSFCLRNVRQQVLHLAFSPDLSMGLLCSDHVTSRQGDEQHRSHLTCNDVNRYSHIGSGLQRIGKLYR